MRGRCLDWLTKLQTVGLVFGLEQIRYQQSWKKRLDRIKDSAIPQSFAWSPISGGLLFLPDLKLSEIIKLSIYKLVSSRLIFGEKSIISIGYEKLKPFSKPFRDFFKDSH